MRRWYEDWEKLNPVLADGEVGEIIGMVQTKTGDGVSTWKELSFTPPAAESDSIPGLPTVRKFPFAFDTPDLATGAVVYTPTVGDVLLDAWIEIDTAWDGTTPLGDFGPFADTNQGLLVEAGLSALKMDAAESDGGYGANGLLNGAQVRSLAMSHTLRNIPNTIVVSSDPALGVKTGSPAAYNGFSAVPAKWRVANPIKVVVSRDGTTATTDATVTAASAPTLPLTVVAASNDTFTYDSVVYTIAPGTYTTLAELTTAIGAATHAGTAFSTVVAVTNDSTALVFTAAGDLGANANGKSITGIDANTGLTNPTTFAGGVGGDPGSTQGSAVLYLVTVTPV